MSNIQLQEMNRKNNDSNDDDGNGGGGDCGDIINDNDQQQQQQPSEPTNQTLPPIKLQKKKPPPLSIIDNNKISKSNNSTTNNNNNNNSSMDDPKTPNTPGPLSAESRLRKQMEKERKIGHRRVDDEGQVTYKKFPTTQIMGSIQLGIGHAVGSLASKPERDLLMKDFMEIELVQFNKEGSQTTPAHHYSDFKFKVYAPIAFRYFRDLFGIQPDDYLLSLCNEPLRELSNPGASGSVFYLTHDDNFIIKTVQHKEAEFLLKLLPGYYMNLNQNPRTLLPKFFGQYCYICGGKNVRFVVMNNLLPSFVKMHQKYDLKGSTYKRKANKYERQKQSPTYKDLDFMEHHPDGIYLENDTYYALIKTMQRDCRVLESFKIMDYSLLVGVHNLDQSQKEKEEKYRQQQEQNILNELNGGNNPENDIKQQQSNNANNNKYNQQQQQRFAAFSTALESIQAEIDPIDAEDDIPPGGIPARNSKGERLLLYVGIIDILQSYRLRKKLEHTWKSVLHDGDSISVHRPGFYAQRFHDFMSKKVFRKIPSRLTQPKLSSNVQQSSSSTAAASTAPQSTNPSKQPISVQNHSFIPPHGTTTTVGFATSTATHPQFPSMDSTKCLKTAVVIKQTYNKHQSIIQNVNQQKQKLLEQHQQQNDTNSTNNDQQQQCNESTIGSSVGTMSSSITSSSCGSGSSNYSNFSNRNSPSIGGGGGGGSSSSTASSIRNVATIQWTPPHSVGSITPSHTEGTPSLTESSDSEYYPSTPLRKIRSKMINSNDAKSNNNDDLSLKKIDLKFNKMAINDDGDDNDDEVQITRL